MNITYQDEEAWAATCMMCPTWHDKSVVNTYIIYVKKYIFCNYEGDLTKKIQVFRICVEERGDTGIADFDPI